MVAPIVLDGPINGDWLEAYVIHVLVPELRLRRRCYHAAKVQNKIKLKD